MECQYRSWTIALLCAILAAGITPPVGMAQDPAPTGEAPDSATLAKDLAAVTAFRKLVAAHSYQLPDEKVREIVLDYLKRDGGTRAKQLPTAEQLEGDLDLDFETVWNSLTKRATAGLDPDGRLKLEERLKAYLISKTQLRAEAEKKYDAYLENGLPPALVRVGGQLVKEQQSQLRQALTELIAADRITQEAIYEAFDGKSESVVDECAAKVTKKLPQATRDTLLLDAASSLSADVKKIIEDGVAQLKEQMLLLELRPQAVSLPGMEKEFEEKLHLLAQDQMEQRKDKSLRPAYGEFGRATEGVKKAAKAWFDELVAGQGTAVADALIRGKLVPARQDADKFRDMILGAPAKHQSPDASWAALQPAILATCDNARVWITSPLETTRGQSKSEVDQEYSAAAFREDVRTAMEAEGTKAQGAWRALNEALKKHFKEKLLPELRSEIAEKQAAQYAPDLVRGKWIPTERELTGHRTPLDETALRKLSVWKGGPPMLAAVLEETWAVWKEQADKAFAIGENALRGQAGLVAALEPAILKLMRAEEDEDAGAWTVRYSAAVASRWKKDPSGAATKYPELFKGTKDMIAGIVAKLIDKVAAEREAAAARAIAAKEAAEKAKEKDKSPAQAGSGLIGDEKGAELPGALLPSSADLPVATVPEMTEKPSAAAEAAAPAVAPAEKMPIDDSRWRNEFGRSGDLMDLRVETEVPEELVPDVWGPARWSDSGDDRHHGVSDDWAARRVGWGVSGSAGSSGGGGGPIGDPPGGMSGGKWGGDGGGDGNGGWYAGRIYRIGFWFLMFLLFVQAGCWYWNVRYLKEYVAARLRKEDDSAPSLVDVLAERDPVRG